MSLVYITVDIVLLFTREVIIYVDEFNKRYSKRLTLFCSFFLFHQQMYIFELLISLFFRFVRFILFYAPTDVPVFWASHCRNQMLVSVNNISIVCSQLPTEGSEWHCQIMGLEIPLLLPMSIIDYIFYHLCRTTYLMTIPCDTTSALV